MKHFSIAVTELANWVYRNGDLNYENSHYGRDRAAEGRLIHRWLQKKRLQEWGDSYQKEVSVSVQEVFFQEEVSDMQLLIRGRIDGVMLFPDSLEESICSLEEIKSIARDYDERDKGQEQIHWAQLYLYAYLWGQSQASDTLCNSKMELNLVYVQVEDRQIFTQTQTMSWGELEQFYQQTLKRFIAWASIWAKHEEEKLCSAQQLEFPYPQFRAGQRQMSAQIYQAIRHSEPIMVQAATGIGKTLASLFPAIKALGKGHIERILFLSARTIGQQVAREGVALLRENGQAIFDITITAKGKVCLEPDAGCDPKLCPYAENYFDKLSAAMHYAIEQNDSFHRQNLDEMARQFMVCPFELSLDLAHWCDVIICDYNYLYDPSVSLKRLFLNDSKKSVALIDEAHNLVERAREMYSATWQLADWVALKRLVKKSYPQVASHIKRVVQLFPQNGENNSKQSSEQLDLLAPIPPSEPLESELFPASTRLKVSDNLQAYSQLPERLLKTLHGLRFQMEAVLSESAQLQHEASFLERFFELKHFLNMAVCFEEEQKQPETQGNSFVCLYDAQKQSAGVEIFCRSPARQISRINAALHSLCYFSATLSPQDYYAHVLGDGEIPSLTIPSPFPEQHQLTLMATHIATTYQQREQSLGEIQKLIRSACLLRAGNYLVFFPSYQYLEKFLDGFEPAELQLIVQQRDMLESEKEHFLAQFKTSSSQSKEKGSILGVAVMGAGFSEGIDLSGDRLIGCFIVGVGLPQINFRQDLIKDYYQNFGQEPTELGKHAGFAYAYQYPGITKVLQSAGRLIRSDRDKGFVLLMDTRYARPEYWRHLPPWWKLQQTKSSQQTLDSIRLFWQAQAE